MTTLRRGSARFAATAAIAVVTALGFASPALAQGDPPEPTHGQDAADECVGCHALPDIRFADEGRYRPDLLVTSDDVRGSIHGTFACVDCHSKLQATMHARIDAARHSCATCHADQEQEYEAGYHGTEGEGPRPTCITCHGSHQVQDADTREYLHRASEQCARCHEQMNQRFLGGNVFGMETHLAGQDVATCADCHGYHTVLPTEDERSPVNEANILSTCRKCHTDAPPNFADVQMHLADVPIPEDPRLRIVTIYMLTLLIGTFGFFGYLTVLGIRHELRRQTDGPRSSSPDRGGVL